MELTGFTVIIQIVKYSLTKKENSPSDKAPTIYINGIAVFGGVDIK